MVKCNREILNGHSLHQIIGCICNSKENETETNCLSWNDKMSVLY